MPPPTASSLLEVPAASPPPPFSPALPPPPLSRLRILGHSLSNGSRPRLGALQECKGGGVKNKEDDEALGEEGGQERSEGKQRKRGGWGRGGGRGEEDETDREE